MHYTRQTISIRKLAVLWQQRTRANGTAKVAQVSYTSMDTREDGDKRTMRKNLLKIRFVFRILGGWIKHSAHFTSVSPDWTTSVWLMKIVHNKNYSHWTRLDSAEQFVNNVFGLLQLGQNRHWFVFGSLWTACIQLPSTICSKLKPFFCPFGYSLFNMIIQFIQFTQCQVIEQAWWRNLGGEGTSKLKSWGSCW